MAAPLAHCESIFSKPFAFMAAVFPGAQRHLQTVDFYQQALRRFLDTSHAGGGLSFAAVPQFCSPSGGQVGGTAGGLKKEWGLSAAWL
ncbi:MAG TPA: hypothetical protein VFW43_01640 [Polaromonas sp.]|nr:hypothetical protein [Polaromonas sp.]